MMKYTDTEQSKKKNMFRFPDCFDPVSQHCPLLLCPLLLLGNEGRSKADDPANTMPSEQFDMVCLGGGVAAGEATRLIQPTLKVLSFVGAVKVGFTGLFTQAVEGAATATLGGSFGLPCLHLCTSLLLPLH